jgi:HK97 family phage major capsid protein
MDDARDGIKEMKNGHRKSISLNLKEMKDMTFAGNFPTASASVATVRPGIIPGANRKLHIRQLLQPGTMSGSTYNYVKESSISGGPVGPAAEGTLKPQIDINLAEVASPAQWIAGFLVASRNMMDDILAFSSYLQTRLPELLLNAEDNQIINGTGTSPQLSGILDTGNFTAASSTATAKVSRLIESIGQLEGFDREANGILLNPADYYSMMLNATTAGEFTLPDMLTTIVNGQLFLAGVPVFKSTALAADNFIVGDWVMGANLITREPVRVEFFYEDSTNVRQNNVTVRVEERVALPIYGNNYFIAGDFA